MKDIKLSLIIPVYNVEKYIEKCIDSILQQNANSDKYEIIFVIDGSKDKSESIIRNKIANQKDTSLNIKILNKENGGLSSARNLGIVNSIGEYLWFIDSDDWIDSDSINYILQLIEKEPVDIIAQTVYYQESKSQTRIFYRYNYSKYIDGPNFCNINHSTAAQFYIVNRQFWDSLNFKFYIGILHEDAELTPRMLYSAKRIFITNKPLYHILKREGSITHTINPKRCYDYIIVLDSLYSFYNKNVSNNHKRIFAKILVTHLLGLLNISLQVDTTTQLDINKYLLSRRCFTNILLKTCNIKYIFLAICFKVYPSNPLYIYKLLRN